MYKYEIIDTSDEKGEIKTGKATLDELSRIIPIDIYEQIRNNQTIEFELLYGNQIYRINKIL
jgi:hypothetical protein